MLTTATLVALIISTAQANGVEPAFALAVARVESGTASQQFRCGPIGKKGRFYGPFGIHRDYRQRWAIDRPEVNVQVGVRALRGQDKRAVLRRYNKSFNKEYWRAVCKLYHQYGGRRM